MPRTADPGLFYARKERAGIASLPPLPPSPVTTHPSHMDTVSQNSTINSTSSKNTYSSSHRYSILQYNIVLRFCCHCHLLIQCIFLVFCFRPPLTSAYSAKRSRRDDTLQFTTINTINTNITTVWILTLIPVVFTSSFQHRTPSYCTVEI